MSDDIAIVGIAGKFSSAQDVADFYDALVERRTLIRSLTDDELARVGSTARQPNFVPVTSSMPDALRFDGQEFGLSQRDCEIMDPQQRKLLEIIRTASDDTQLDLTEEVVGVFAASALSTYMVRHLLTLPEEERPPEYAMLLGNEKDFVATRVAHLLGYQGPAVAVQSACSSSLLAVHEAVLALLGGDCTIAVAGGVSISYPEARGFLHQSGGIISPTGRCRPFDKEADGTITADGAGAVVLMMGEDARQRNIPAYATIMATAANNDGRRRAGFTAPSPSGQADAIHAAHSRAGTLDGTIGYIETHGTGTSLGDPIEIAGLTQALQDTAGPTKIQIGSLKANVGHLDVAAGVASVIKVALMRRSDELLPQVNYDQPNPGLAIENSPFEVNTQRTPWPSDRPFAGISAFGIGGTNVHAVLGPWHGRQHDLPRRSEQGSTFAPVTIWSQPTETKSASLGRDLPPTIMTLSGVMELFEEFLDGSVNPETDFYDAGGDSLSAVELIDTAKRRWTCELSVPEFEMAPTPRGLFGGITQSGTQKPRVVTLRNTGRPEAPALILIHPAGGTVARYRDLERHLPADWDLLAIPYVLDEPGERPTVRELAERYAALITSEIAPSSPLVLGGFSLGGNIAHEITNVSVSVGTRCIGLLLLDSLPPGAYPPVPPSPNTIDRVGGEVLAGTDTTDDVVTRETMRAIWRATSTCLFGYAPSGVTDVPTVLLVAESQTNDAFTALGIEPEKAEPWSDWCREVKSTIRVPGNHYTMLEGSQHIETVGNEIARALALFQNGVERP